MHAYYFFLYLKRGLKGGKQSQYKTFFIKKLWLTKFTCNET